MKNKKLIILIVVLICLFPISAILYNYAQSNTDTSLDVAQNLAENESTENSDEPAENNTEESTENNSDANTVEPTENPEIPMLDFTLLNTEGEEVTLSDLNDEPIVLNFWATWCNPCREEMPYMASLENKYEDDVNFVMVNVQYEGGDTEEDAIEYLDEMDFGFENVLYDVDSQVASMYGIPGFPTTFFINEDGNIESAYAYSLPEDLIESEILNLIN